MESAEKLAHPEMMREKQFTELRNKVHKELEAGLEKRLQMNPNPSDEELRVGAFFESIEPQVRDAVLKIFRKGYTTESSGFSGNGFTKQEIRGSFSLSEEIKAKLENAGLEVKEPFHKVTEIYFSPEKPNLDEIKAKWDEIADLFPDTGKPAPPAIWGEAEGFRKPQKRDSVLE